MDLRNQITYLQNRLVDECAESIKHLGDKERDEEIRLVLSTKKPSIEGVLEYHKRQILKTISKTGAKIYADIVENGFDERQVRNKMELFTVEVMKQIDK